MTTPSSTTHSPLSNRASEIALQDGQIRQQHQASRAYPYSSCKEAEACSSQLAVNCFTSFRIETSYAASIGNLLTAHVTETLTSLDAYTRNCTRAFRERITYSTRILVGCNTKETDILGRNCLTASRCTEALSSPDCDTQIGVQTVGECKYCLPAYSTAYSASSTYTIEALSHCGRPVPHVRWEAESIWPAAKSEQAVVSSQLRQMQSRQQMWPHTKPHYVILPCGGLTCFQNGQIRSISSSACIGQTVGPHITFADLPIFFFDAPLSLGILSLSSCLQALPRAFRHLSAYRLGHAKCLKSWEQWDTHGDALFAFRSPPPYFGGVLTPPRGSHYFGGVRACCLFVCFARPPPVNR
ncbi:hypothetical protein G7Y79_00009g026410 [Physcia stellaris]|nr:hypothetical protein G7Y79_00009g026410 [Physcia stellaris]